MLFTVILENIDAGKRVAVFKGDTAEEVTNRIKDTVKIPDGHEWAKYRHEDGVWFVFDPEHENPDTAAECETTTFLTVKPTELGVWIVD